MTEKSTIVGRHPDCAININDPAVSRHHCQIYQIESEYFVEDLKSNNGTLVNGRVIEAATRLFNGDSICCCDYQLTFLLEPDSEAEFEGTHRLPDAKREKKIENSGGEKILAILSTDSQSESKRLAHNTEAKLRAVSQISSTLGGIMDIDELVSHLLNELPDLFPQLRNAVVIFVDPKSDQINIAGQYNHAGESNVQVKMSKTVVKRVLETSNGILIEDLSKASEFESSESLQQSLIRSMLCVPWMGQTKPAGIIHIDTNKPDQLFTTDDLDVAVSIAAQAGLAFQRARLYQEVRHAYQYANRIVQTVRIPLLVVNAEFCVVTANQSFYDTFPLEVNQTEGSDFWNLADGQWDDPALRVGMATALTSTTDLIDYELERQFPDKGRMTMLISARRIREDSEVSRGSTPPGAELLISIQDISKRVENEAKIHDLNIQLSHASRTSLIGTMAAGITHELHQPLASIANFANGCQLGLNDDAKANGMCDEFRSQLLQRLKDIESEAQRCGEVMRSIRDFIKRRKVNAGHIDVAVIVSDALKLAELTGSGDGNIDVVTELPDDLPQVYVDQIQLTQVLLNLIVNAREAIEESPRGNDRISVKCRSIDGENVEISVVDTGPGIKEEIVERVFHQFITTKQKGLGIGLAICQTILQAHHSKLGCHSTSDGTTFAFTVSNKPFSIAEDEEEVELDTAH